MELQRPVRAKFRSKLNFLFLLPLPLPHLVQYKLTNRLPGSVSMFLVHLPSNMFSTGRKQRVQRSGRRRQTPNWFPGEKINDPRFVVDQLTAS